MSTYNILSDDAQFQSDLFTHEKLNLHGDSEKKKKKKKRLVMMKRTCLLKKVQ